MSNSVKQKRSFHPLYATWYSMVYRCTVKKGKNGITVCPRWLVFKNFVEDMGERPDGTFIDRIDNNGNYEPSNCRWVSPGEQTTNIRKAKKYKNIDSPNMSINEHQLELALRWLETRVQDRKAIKEIAPMDYGWKNKLYCLLLAIRELFNREIIIINPNRKD